MKKATLWLAWIFITLGLFLSIMVIFSIYHDGKFQYGTLDWKYAQNLNNVASILGFLFTGAGTFAIFITLSKQQEQFDQAQKQIVTQQFETTFFNMLNQLFGIKNSIRGSVDGKSFSGQEFLHGVLMELKEKYQQHLISKVDINDVLDTISINEVPILSKLQMVKDDLNEVYVSSYEMYYSQLGHYFRYLYNLVKFTIENREGKSFSDSKKYVQLIQAQLSNDELGLIFCNSLSDKSLNSEKENRIFKWLEEHSLLENIDSHSLLHRSLHAMYPSTDFKFLNRDERKKWKGDVVKKSM